jgi:hypothetical protein
MESPQKPTKPIRSSTSWEMPVPSWEYELFSSFTFGHVLGLENLHVTIIYILGNVLVLDDVVVF